MKVAVDVLIGTRGVRLLEEAGHDVVVEARHGESDQDWFMRAIAKGVEVVIAIDGDLKVLCWGHRVPFLRAKVGLNGRENARRAIKILQRYGARLVSGARP